MLSGLHGLVIRINFHLLKKSEMTRPIEKKAYVLFEILKVPGFSLYLGRNCLLLCFSSDVLPLYLIHELKCLWPFRGAR